MPIYEYTCEACGEKFEKLTRSMTDRDQSQRCPGCGSEKTARSLSVFAVGAESAGRNVASAAPGMCGRCGGPGPCAGG